MSMLRVRLAAVAGGVVVLGMSTIARAVEPPVPGADASAPTDNAESAPVNVTPKAPVRVGGNTQVQITRELVENMSKGGETQKLTIFRFERCRIETPLPAGYPDPTPPGAIDLKEYPSVRRAQVKGTGNMDLGTNVGFFPLFRHISARQIAMTSPVEVDSAGFDPDASMDNTMPKLVSPPTPTPSPTNSGPDSPKETPVDGEATEKSESGTPGQTVDVADGSVPGGDVPGEGRRAEDGSWTMSFLYRTSELGPVAKDGVVEVVDTKPMTVLAMGVRGSYSQARIQDAVRQIREWLAGQEEWEEDGAPRAFYYNGPDVPEREKWSEAQVPVRRKAAAPGKAAEGASAGSSGEVQSAMPVPAPQNAP